MSGLGEIVTIAPDRGEAARSTLDVQDAVAGGRHTLVLSGELDMASGPELHATMVRLCDYGAREIVLNVTKLDFMDSSGLQAILAGQSICRDHGVDFMLTPAKGAVRRVFELCGVLDVLPFQP
jgi:anti-sigma B factor antagonist